MHCVTKTQAKSLEVTTPKRKERLDNSENCERKQKKILAVSATSKLRSGSIAHLKHLSCQLWVSLASYDCDFSQIGWDKSLALKAPTIVVLNVRRKVRTNLKVIYIQSSAIAFLYDTLDLQNIVRKNHHDWGISLTSRNFLLQYSAQWRLCAKRWNPVG